jgi:hypothetical protein
VSVQPSQSRGVPPFDQAAADSLAAVHGQQRPQYAPPQPDPEQAALEQQASAAGKLCGLCLGIHELPGTAACPRLASVELNPDGTVKAATFWPGLDWAKGRVVLWESLHEKGSGPAKGKRKKGGGDG